MLVKHGNNLTPYWSNDSLLINVEQFDLWSKFGVPNLY